MPKCLLAVDTATEICGIALVVDGRIHAELMLSRGITHTQSVLSAIDAVLAISGLTAGDVDAYAVTRGPGSFTGLRIGISTVKGLAFATAKPMVGISSLEVLAHQAPDSADLICPLMDARRNEVYWALYRREKDGIKAIMAERVGPATEVADAIQAPCQFIGNGVPTYRSVLRKKLTYPAQWAGSALNNLRPAVLARKAWQRLQEGKTDDPRTFEPVYLRKSDAELHWKGDGAISKPGP
jgi:tRNA threonylcarbamoyladenosine biosynthesis protein TsaB